MPTPEEQIDAIIEPVMRDLGYEIVADIQEQISIHWPPASSPFNPPHLRTGELHAGVTFDYEQTGSTYVLSITSNMFYSLFLEYGTDRMIKRPYMLPALEHWTPLVIDRLQAAFPLSSSGIMPVTYNNPPSTNAA